MGVHNHSYVGFFLFGSAVFVFFSSCSFCGWLLTSDRSTLLIVRVRCHNRHHRCDRDVEDSWCRKVLGMGRRGISFAWRQHRFFFVDFSLLALSYDKLEETGREGGGGGEGGVRARGWGEAHSLGNGLETHCDFTRRFVSCRRRHL